MAKNKKKVVPPKVQKLLDDDAKFVAPKAKPSQRAVSAKARTKAQTKRAAAKKVGIHSPSEEWNRSQALKNAKKAKTGPKPTRTTTTRTSTHKKQTKQTQTKKKKKKNPKAVPVTAPPPTKIDDTQIVRTQRQGVPVTGTAYTSNIIQQEQDILNAFLTLSGTELFQYTNSRTIDGMFDDVSIISVLSSRRRGYSPNTIIETVIPVIKSVTREGDILHVVVERSVKGRRIIMEFYVGSNISEVGSQEYV